MAWMAQLPSGGHQTWTCGCGRLGLAVALETCPACGASREDALAPQAVVPAAVAAPVTVPARQRRPRQPRAAKRAPP